jgi:hypothetical protein
MPPVYFGPLADIEVAQLEPTAHRRPAIAQRVQAEIG